MKADIAGRGQDALFAIPEPPPTPANGWGVLVHETRILATRQGADWWLLYSGRFIDTPRMTCLGLNPMGGEWHVACDSKEDAKSLAEHMVSFGGVPKSAVEVRRLSECKRVGS